MPPAQNFSKTSLDPPLPPSRMSPSPARKAAPSSRSRASADKDLPGLIASAIEGSRQETLA